MWPAEDWTWGGLDGLFQNPPGSRQVATGVFRRRGKTWVEPCWVGLGSSMPAPRVPLATCPDHLKKKIKVPDLGLLG